MWKVLMFVAVMATAFADGADAQVPSSSIGSDTTVKELIARADLLQSNFEKSHSAFMRSVEIAIRSGEVANKRLDELDLLVTPVVEQFSDGSEFWKAVEEVRSKFSNGKVYAEKESLKGIDTEYWRGSIAKWGKQIDKVEELRGSIMKYRAEVVRAQTSIKNLRPRIIDMVRHEEAGVLLAEMEALKDSIRAIATTVTDVVKKTKGLDIQDGSGAPRGAN
jgi:hypothetical protein